MLYEMITGQAPFTGSNVYALMNNRLSNDPPPPRKINSAISPQLEEIVWRALAREPQNRYSSATELAWDLSHQNQVIVGAHEAAERKDRRKQRWHWVWRFLHLAGPS
jgi:serine/threonine protein kinase